jgi:micrococcal nuclease
MKEKLGFQTSLPVPDNLYTYKATVLHIVDADTMDLLIDCGFNINFKVRIRLADVNAWELRGEHTLKGKIATQRALELCPVDCDVIVETLKDKQGKYGRYLARIYPPECGGEDLGTILLREGHAVPY